MADVRKEWEDRVKRRMAQTDPKPSRPTYDGLAWWYQYAFAALVGLLVLVLSL